MCDRCADGFTFFGLAEPQAGMLDAYKAALMQGWSPGNSSDVSKQQLQSIAADPAAFIAGLLSQTGTRTLPDGSMVQRLPSRTRWLWDGDFCGVISLRYQPGRNDLPPDVAGHVGYAVVPWKRRHGYASRALKQMLDEAREVGLTRLEITTEPDNIASRTVIERNGGVRAGDWSHPAFPATGTLDKFVITV